MDLTHVPTTELRRRLAGLDTWIDAFRDEYRHPRKTAYLPSSVITERDLLHDIIQSREKFGDPILRVDYLYHT